MKPKAHANAGKQTKQAPTVGKEKVVVEAGKKAKGPNPKKRAS